MRCWGCLSKVNVSINKKRELGPKTHDCVFLGYPIRSVSYRFLSINSRVLDMLVSTILQSRDATFFESEFPRTYVIALLVMNLLYPLRFISHRTR